MPGQPSLPLSRSLSERTWCEPTALSDRPQPETSCATRHRRQGRPSPLRCGRSTLTRRLDGARPHSGCAVGRQRLDGEEPPAARIDTARSFRRAVLRHRSCDVHGLQQSAKTDHHAPTHQRRCQPASAPERRERCPFQVWLSRPESALCAAKPRARSRPWSAGAGITHPSQEPDRLTLRIPHRTGGR